jgi:Ca2+-binding RTX toxin-like protein
MQLTRIQLVAALASATLVVPAVALAATIDGGPASERLRGTNLADTINGNGGNDRIHGRGGADQLNGGRGNDRMSGGTGDDIQVGGAGNDVIYANRGQDTSLGGDGDDVLWALARADVAPGPGVDQVGDSLDGGDGNDVFRTRDGEFDRITCGPGEDRALLDRVDVITDATAASPNGSCEIVKRKGARAAGSRGEGPHASPKEDKVSG